jgi:hypothetical protein
MIDAIKIDPECRYVLFVRDADPEWTVKTQGSLERWFKSESPVLMINIPEQATVYLEKVKVNERKQKKGN